MPGGVVSKFNVQLADDYAETATFRTANIDKLDVTATLGDVQFQVEVNGTRWEPEGGIVVPAGIFRSFPGLALVWQPPPTAVRFRRARKSSPAIVAFDAFMVE